MPLAFAGLQIDSDQTLAIEAIAWSMAAVVVARRHLDRQVNDPELFVHGDLSPHTRVARVRRGSFEPRVGAEFARLRNRVEDPEPLAGAHVEPTHVPLLVGLALRHAAFRVRGADDDDVLHHHGRRMKADLAFDRVHFLIVELLQIDHAIGAEARDQISGLRIEGDHLVAGRDIEDSLLLAVAPVQTGPRPTTGAARPHLVSLREGCGSIQRISPLVGSSATTARREPAVT